MSFLFGILLFSAFMAVVIVTIFQLHRRRQRRLSKRTTIALDTLLMELGMHTEREKTLGRDVLRILGKELDVHPACLRPTDRFDVEFRSYPPWLEKSDIVLDSFEERLIALTASHGFEYTLPKELRTWNLKELMDDLRQRLRHMAEQCGTANDN